MEVLSTAIVGRCEIGMSRVSVAFGVSLEVAVTSLDRLPLPARGEPFASSSAWLKVCVALQVIEPPTGMVAAVQTMSSASLSSLSDRPVMVTLPVLVTR